MQFKLFVQGSDLDKSTNKSCLINFEIKAVNKKPYLLKELEDQIYVIQYPLESQ